MSWPDLRTAHFHGKELENYQAGGQLLGHLTELLLGKHGFEL